MGRAGLAGSHGLGQLHADRGVWFGLPGSRAGSASGLGRGGVWFDLVVRRPGGRGDCTGGQEKGEGGQATGLTRGGGER